MLTASDLAAWAYEAEVVGEALFAELATTEPHPARREQLSVLAALERATAARLAPVLSRLAVTPADECELTERGRAAALAVRALPWSAFLRAIGDAVDPAIDRYLALRALLPAVLHETMDAVVAHEEALRTFVAASEQGAADPVEAARRLLARP